MAREQWAETGVGAVVLVAAASFLIYSLNTVSAGRGHGYEVSARFGQAGGLAPGAAVSVAGVKVGTVTSIALDPKTFVAVVRLDLDPSVKLPSDSTAKITSDSLLGGAHVAIEPGGAADDLKPGAEFENTQGAVDLFGLLGQMLRPQAPSGDAASAQQPDAGAKPAASSAPGA
ncbi:MAG TPA: outer membrane lipid asymmetry maintenance protein MlaD [Caulobacteraceae bacterium]|jgi:phospholipid/cholesterol/gamma-HCH transport system substrate-binding protein|nr:outer membrane lipid asymmetry maintenance protein MlaD [Caulobacteraceae bacterium]